MASRKKAKGKARKAAKAQQQEEAAAVAANQRGSLHSQLIDNKTNTTTSSSRTARYKKVCQHGFGSKTFPHWHTCDTFMGEFMTGFNSTNGHNAHDLRAAHDMTTEKYGSTVWSNVDMLNWIKSCFIANGTRYLLDGTPDKGGVDAHATKDYAIIALYIEQYIAITLTKTQTTFNWDAISSLQMDANPTKHMLVSFYHSRNPCSCLNKLFREGEETEKFMRKVREEEERREGERLLLLQQQQQQEQQEEKKKNEVLLDTTVITTSTSETSDNDDEEEQESNQEVSFDNNDSSGSLEYWKSLTGGVQSLWGGGNSGGGEEPTIQQTPSLN
jgi:hypothetical protein